MTARVANEGSSDSMQELMDHTAYHKTRKFSLLGYVLRKIDSLLMHLFFGDVDVVGMENIPSSGPCLLVGNHKNQFVDALMVVFVANRPVSFLVAEKSMHRGLVGMGARLTGAIPVIRPQDLARHPTHGGLLIGYCPETRVLTGSKECAFTRECEPGESILISGFPPVQILNVRNDYELELKAALRRDDDMSSSHFTLQHGTKYKIVPRVEQKEMFETVFAALEQGKCIGIFPEGGSSDRTDLLPLKSGVSIMALGAKCRGTPVQVVPFGINYEKGDAWRSKVLVHIGKPVPMSTSLMQKYADNPKEATQEYLQQVERRLRGVTFNAPDQRTLLIMRVMRRLFQGNSKLSLAEFMELNRRFALAFSKFSNNDLFLDLVGRVHAYIILMESARVTDREIAALPRLGGLKQTLASTCSLVWIACTIATTFLLFLPVWLVFLPSLLRINHVVKQEVKRALATSTVKVEAIDVAASQKIFSGLIWIPFTVLVCTICALVATLSFWPMLVNPFDPVTQPGLFALHSHAVWLLPVSVLLLLPVIGVVHIKVFDFQTNQMKSALYHMLVLRPHKGNKLRTLRKELAFRVQEYYHEHIRPAFPEWEYEEILPRSTVIKLRAQSDFEASERVLAEMADLELGKRPKKLSGPGEELTPDEQMMIRLLQPNMISVGGRISSNNKIARE